MPRTIDNVEFNVVIVYRLVPSLRNDAVSTVDTITYLLHGAESFLRS